MLTEEQYPGNWQAEACSPLCQCLIPRGRCPGWLKSRVHTRHPGLPGLPTQFSHIYPAGPWSSGCRYPLGFQAPLYIWPGGSLPRHQPSVMDVRPGLIRERQWFLWGPEGIRGLPWWCGGKESACQTGDGGLIPWRRKWQPTPVFLPGKSHEQRSLMGYSPRGCKELDTT